MSRTSRAITTCFIAVFMLVGVMAPSSGAQDNPVYSCDVGVLVGTDCFIEGPPPTSGNTCLAPATLSPQGDCYTVVGGVVTVENCVAGYQPFGSICQATNTGTSPAERSAFMCPPAPAQVTESASTSGGIVFIDSCSYVPGSTETCPAGTTANPTGGCRRPAPLSNGGLSCTAPFVLNAGRCVQVVPATASTDPTPPAPTDLTCDAGVLVGTSCVVEGPPPTPGALTCPVSATVMVSPTGECFTISSGFTMVDSCVAPYMANGAVCTAANPGTTLADRATFVCPPAPVTPTESASTSSGIIYIDSCSYVPGSTETCPVLTIPDPAGGCRSAVELVMSNDLCPAPYELIDMRCLLITPATSATQQTVSTSGLGQPLDPVEIPAVTGAFVGGDLACGVSGGANPAVTIVVPPILNVWIDRDLDVQVDIAGATAFDDELPPGRTIVIPVTPAMTGDQVVTFNAVLLTGANYSVTCDGLLSL